MLLLRFKKGLTFSDADANITKVERQNNQSLGVAQFGSVLEWGSRGRKFKSSHPDQEQKSRIVGSFALYIIFLLKSSRFGLRFMLSYRKITPGGIYGKNRCMEQL